MTILKRLLAILLVLVLLLVAVAFLLPREVAFARSAVIDAPASEIFPLVNSMQETAKWSPWMGRDPEIELAYSGPTEGVGNRLAWRSENPQVGSGTQVITLSEPDSRVETDLDFGAMGTAAARFELAEEGSSTKVTWGFVTDTGFNPIARWMGLKMDDWVGADYELGLANLKALVEG